MPGKPVVFIDLDNTLAPRATGPDAAERNVGGVCMPPAAVDVEALDAFAEAGGLCLWCTGRPRSGINPQILAIPHAGMVTMAGARATLRGRMLFENRIPAERLERLLGFLLEVTDDIVVETEDESVAIGPNTSLRPHIRTVADFAALRVIMPDLPVGKICMDPRGAEALLAAPEVLGDYSLVDTAGGVWETTPPQTSKCAGVQAVLEALGDEAGTSYGIGDSENDLPLFEAVDVRVAMGNATDAVKAAADWVSAGVTEGGVAAALEHFGLITRRSSVQIRPPRPRNRRSSPQSMACFLLRVLKGVLKGC